MTFAYEQKHGCCEEDKERLRPIRIIPASFHYVYNRPGNINSTEHSLFSDNVSGCIRSCSLFRNSELVTKRPLITSYLYQDIHIHLVRVRVYNYNWDKWYASGYHPGGIRMAWYFSSRSSPNWRRWFIILNDLTAVLPLCKWTKSTKILSRCWL